MSNPEEVPPVEGTPVEVSVEAPKEPSLTDLVAGSVPIVKQAPTAVTSVAPPPEPETKADCGCVTTSHGVVSCAAHRGEAATGAQETRDRAAVAVVAPVVAPPPKAPEDLIAEVLATLGAPAFLREVTKQVKIDSMLKSLNANPDCSVQARLYLLSQTPIKAVALPAEMGPQIMCVYYNPNFVAHPVRATLCKGLGASAAEGTPPIATWVVRGDFRGRPDEAMQWTAEQCAPYLYEPTAFMVLQAHREMALTFGVALPPPKASRPTPPAAKKGPGGAVAQLPVETADSTQSRLALALLDAVGPDKFAQEYPELRDVILRLKPNLRAHFEGGTGESKIRQHQGPPSRSAEEARAATESEENGPPVVPTAANPKGLRPQAPPKPRAPWEGEAVVVADLPNGWSWVAPGRVAQGPDKVYAIYAANPMEIQNLTKAGQKVHKWTTYRVGLNDNPGMIFATNKTSLTDAIDAIANHTPDAVIPDEIITNDDDGGGQESGADPFDDPDRW